MAQRMRRHLRPCLPPRDSISQAQAQARALRRRRCHLTPTANAQTRSCCAPSDAAVFNGGKPSFPHRLCYDNVTDDAVVVDTYSVVGQQLSFTIRGTGAAPLHAACTQDLFRISFNSCECTVT
jgi:hypothetical protein